jgi:protoporphyrinogen oxidase
VIKTLIEAFRYPALGPGQMWDAVGARLARNGRRVVRNARVVSIERGAHGATRVITADGRTYAPTDLLSSMPLRELIEIVHPAAPESVRSAAAALGYRDFITVALVIAAPNLFADNWIYIHDEGVKLGRIQNFKNWSPQMVPDPNATCLGLEYFCFEGDELWNATDKELIALGTAELAKLGLADPADVVDGTVVRQPKAYPVYDDRYQEHLTTIRTWLESALPNVQLIGRNGMHRYNNQDHAMMTGLLAARNIARGEHFNLWAVNSDAIYTEEVRSGESTTLGAQR